MSTYNLATKYETKLDQRFNAGSFTDRWTSNQYTFDGTNAIKVWTLGQANINDYTLTPATGVSRFGAIHEVEDEINTYQLLNKKSFNESIDETNVQDQMFIKKSQALMKQFWDEQVIPTIDAYRLSTWANGAGLGLINGTALTSSTIVKAIMTAHAALNNKRVPHANRCCFVTETMAIETRLADELKYNDAVTTKQIVNGQITTIGGYPVVAIPDDLMPTGVEFMIKYKDASVDPMKMKMLRAITNSENVCGVLMQGLWRYDSFVLAQKCNGIYLYSQSGTVATPTGDNGTTASGKVTLGCTTGSAVIKYTVDGSNPKVSSTAATYSAAFTSPASGSIVRAYASKANMTNSAIFELAIA